MMPKIQLAATASKGDAIVLAWFQSEDEGKVKSAEGNFSFVGKRTKDIDALSTRMRQSKHFKGKKNETSLLRYFELQGFENTLLLGAGSPSKWCTETSRQVGAALYLAQKRDSLSQTVFLADSLFAKVSESELSAYLQAFCEGYWMASYEYKELKKSEEGFSPEGVTLVGLKGNRLEGAIDKARSVAEGVNFARTLGDKPGNHLTPTEFARLTSKMAKDVGLKCSVWGKSEIQKEKMGLFLTVAQGSAEEPKFIVLEHRGGKKTDKPIALVGKGITFDSGGISLKPAARMEEMKYDMMGAAAVAGILQVVADLKLPLNVIGFIAACENMPGGRAQKPGDVQRSRSGKTVEVINTDAEGRLILADALDYAQGFQPQAIIDFATLTGAVVDALGTVVSGLMGNHQGLLGKIKESGQATGERVWELPLFDEYLEDLKSNVADIKNMGIREAGSSKAGSFLKFFVDSKYPWAHLDIAGTAWYRKDVNYHPQKHASGVAVRLMVHMLENWKGV